MNSARSVSAVLAVVLVVTALAFLINASTSSQSPLAAEYITTQPHEANYSGALVHDWKTHAVELAKCSGTKRALLIGQTYPNSKYELLGCDDDVQNLQQVFAKDVQVQVELNLSRNQMESVIQEFASKLLPGDGAVIWYSGHGLLLADGDNAIVPVDFEAAGFVHESWVRGLLSELPVGVCVLIGVDACHSGSSFNLKYDLEPPTLKTLASSRSKTIPRALLSTSASRKALAKAVSIDAVVGDEAAVELYDNGSRFSELYADVVVVSGARDEQTAADALLDGEYQGAMTWAFLESLRVSDGSIGSMQTTMRALLKAAKFTQVPQFSVSRLITPTSACFMDFFQIE